MPRSSTSPTWRGSRSRPRSAQAAVEALDPGTRADTEFAIDNVRRFAEAQLATVRPLEVELLPGVHWATG